MYGNVVNCVDVFYFYCLSDQHHLHSFPTRRSSDLANCPALSRSLATHPLFRCREGLPTDLPDQQFSPSCFEDRKSTRLNSSHITISYAVFCLKKKRLTLPLKLLSPVGAENWQPGST